MKKCILLILSVFALIDSFGQKLDSIKYANGYLYYHDYGKGEPIILLSGGPGVSCNQEQEVAIELSKNYRAILLEQRGTGISIPTPFDSTTINLKAALADLNLLLDHLHFSSQSPYEVGLCEDFKIQVLVAMLIDRQQFDNTYLQMTHK